jgi:hypothetical protein
MLETTGQRILQAATWQFSTALLCWSVQQYKSLHLFKITPVFSCSTAHLLSNVQQHITVQVFNITFVYLFNITSLFNCSTAYPCSTVQHRMSVEHQEPISVAADTVGSKCLSALPLSCDGQRVTTVPEYVHVLEESKSSWVNLNEVKHVWGQAPCKTCLDCGVSECQRMYVRCTVAVGSDHRSSS